MYYLIEICIYNNTSILIIKIDILQMVHIFGTFNSRYLIAFDLMQLQPYISTHVPLRQILTLRTAFCVNHC